MSKLNLETQESIIDPEMRLSLIGQMEWKAAIEIITNFLSTSPYRKFKKGLCISLNLR